MKKKETGSISIATRPDGTQYQRRKNEKGTWDYIGEVQQSKPSKKKSKVVGLNEVIRRITVTDTNKNRFPKISNDHNPDEINIKNQPENHTWVRLPGPVKTYVLRKNTLPTQ